MRMCLEKIIGTDFKRVDVLNSVGNIIDYSLSSKQYIFPVFDKDKPVGTVTYKELMNSHPNRIVADAMTKQCFFISLDKSIWDAKKIFDKKETDILLVMDKKRLVGFINRTDFYMEIGNYFDPLTGLYSRKYFENALIISDNAQQLPLSVLLVDINGIRLINDALGYDKGDKLIRDTAKLLQRCCGQKGVPARVNGGEFALMLLNTDTDAVFKIIEDIKEACSVYNKSKENKGFEINLSIGYATKECPGESITEAVRSANEILRYQKLLNSKSFHSQPLLAIMSALYERSDETEEHSKRLVNMSSMIGKKLKMTPKSLKELEIFAMLHDIGKVGIDDSILKKQGSLTNDEWKTMKMHSEIGYRIVKASPELDFTSEYILTHHERWDGGGYPKGLKGEEIPLLSRILAVADAFDSMTHDRIYRKATSKEKAIEEIKRNSGSQFDPAIVDIFVDII